MNSLGYDPNDTTTDTTTPQGIGNVVAAGRARLPPPRRLQPARRRAERHAPRTRPSATPTTPVIRPENTWNRRRPVALAAAVHPDPRRLPRPGSRCPRPTATCPGAPNYALQKPLTPQWGKVKMFGPLPASQFRVTGPPKNPDGTYSTVDIAHGDRLRRQPRQRQEGQGRVLGRRAGLGVPARPRLHLRPGAVPQERSHSLDADAKLFFMLGNAMMDASIACWYQKYKYDYVRPITAIRYHPASRTSWSTPGSVPNKGFGMVPGSQWMPYQALHVVTPPFPEYVSGHSTFSGAGATILASHLRREPSAPTSSSRQGSSKFESNTPTADVQLSWPTFTARVQRGRRLAPVRRHPLLHRRQPRSGAGQAGRPVRLLQRPELHQRQRPPAEPSRHTRAAPAGRSRGPRPSIGRATRARC